MSWGNFWANCFFSKNVSYQNCFQISSKKTFRFLKKLSAGLAILHPISFGEYSEVIFWRKSTLIKVSSFKEKERKTIWFFSKTLPFFWKLHSVFPEYQLRFLGIIFKLITSFGICTKDAELFQKPSEKLSNCIPRLQRKNERELIASKSPLWILSRKRSDLWKIQIHFFFNWARRSPVFNRKNVYRVAYLQSRCPSLIEKIWNVSQKLFEAIVKSAFWGIFKDAFCQDNISFITTVSKNWGKTFNCLIDFAPDFRHCILFGQRNAMRWFLWRNANLINIFGIRLKNVLISVEKLSEISSNFLMRVQRYILSIFSWTNYNLTFFWKRATFFRNFDLQVLATC